MSITLKVAEYIIKQGKVNHAAIIKEIEGVDNYNRSAEIIDELERCGIVGKFNGYELREIKITDIEKVKQLLIEVNEPEEVKAEKNKDNDRS